LDENEVRLRCRSDARDSIRFVAPANEQLALMANDTFHRIPFR
jgi:hypothetical protein